MPDMIPNAPDELSRLEERTRKLATENSYLQLVIRLMTKVSDASGLEDTISRILHNITDVVGGTNIALYCRSDHEILYEDVLGQKRRLDRIEDELVQRVFTSREAVEFEHDFSATRMTTPEFTKAYTWVYPLLVGPEIVGVIKLESLHLRMRELYQHLPAFFSFVALVLKNGLSGHSRLKQAYTALEQEVAVRQRAVEELGLANATLEARVDERTRELQRSNEQARRINREIQAISNCNQVLMRAVDEPALLNDICRIVCEQAGYRMAWVGYAENDDAKTVRIVARAGVDDGYLAAAHITWDDTEHGRGPTGTAIRTGASQWVDDFATARQVAPWQEPALQRGYRSSLALPLKDESARTFGALSIYATEPNAFPPEEVRLMEELAADLAFGITVLRGRIERQQAEEQLRHSEEKYRSLIHKLQTAVVVHAADTRILICNPVAQFLLGLTEDQLLGKTAIEPAWHFFREDGTPMPPEEYPVNRVRATRQPIRDLVLGVHRPGDAPDVWAMVNATPDFGPDGQITQIIVTFIDITARKQTQERLDHLAAIVESSNDAIIGKALDETIVSWNRGAERIYGYTAGEIVGRPISILVPPGLKEELATIMDGVKRGEGVARLETTRVRKDGQTIPVVLTISPIRDARGQIVGASTIARDNTEHKRMEEALVFVAQRGWQTGGENFFDALARFLGEKLDMDYALIDRIDENPAMAETVALYARGALTPNMRYALKGTPCENVMGQCLCVYPKGIQQLFPEDALLPGMGAESYVGIPLWDSTGRPIGLIAVMGTKPLSDVTPATQLLQLVAPRAAAELERNRAAEALVKLNEELEQRVRERTAELRLEMDSRSRQQQFLEAVLENIDAGIVACDADGILTLFNRRTRELHGLPAKPIPAEQWAENYDLFLPDGKTPMRKEDVPLFRALQGERVVNNEMMIVPRGGEPRILLANGQFILDKEGRKIGAVIAMHDITERKRMEETLRASEEKYRSVVENIGLGVTMIGPGMEILALNACMQKWFPHIDARCHPTCYESFINPPRSGLCVNCPTCQTLQDGLVHEGIIETPSGNQTLYFRVLSSPIKDKDGKVVAATEIVEDVTERRRAEENIQQLNRELRQRASELQTANQELQRMNKLFVGRELRMVELKKRIQELEPRPAPSQPESKT